MKTQSIIFFFSSKFLLTLTRFWQLSISFLNEVVWDWRYDAPYETDEVPNEGGGGFGGGPPQGPIVLPGTYTVALDVGAQSYSTTVEIAADPRRLMTNEDRMARQETLMSLHTLAKPIYEATEAMERLRDQLTEASNLISEHEELPEALTAELEVIEDDLSSIESELRTVRNNAGIADDIQTSSTLPTSDQLQAPSPTFISGLKASDSGLNNMSYNDTRK